MRRLLLLYCLLPITCGLRAQTLVYPDPLTVWIGGSTIKVLERSHEGRLLHFITGADSRAIRIYDRGSVLHSKSEGWDGECTGQWLYTAAKCVDRTGEQLILSVSKRPMATWAPITTQRDSMDYLHFNKELLKITGDPSYASAAAFSSRYPGRPSIHWIAAYCSVSFLQRRWSLQ
jgi:hypothetical protein